MANAREIQTRIKSIQDTMKITNAMYMISSAKLKKARKNLENTEPYFDMLQGTITRIVRHLPEMEHRYFEEGTLPKGKMAEESHGMEKKQTGDEPWPWNKIPEKTSSKKRGYLVIAADKGLAGAYNHNVIKLTEQCLQNGTEDLLFVVGELGREYFIQHDISVYKEFHYAVQDPNLTRARDIAEDFEYKDYFWSYLLVLLLGVLFGVSTNKALKYLAPIIAIFAAFAAFEVLYPRREKIAKMLDGTYEDRFVEFEDTEDIPDFI